MLTTDRARNLLTLAFAVVFGGGLVSLGFATGYYTRGQSASPGSGYGLLEEAHTLLDAHFLGELPGSLPLQRGMIRGMVEASGDPYTTYVEPATHELQSDNLAGEYAGIGATLAADSEGRFSLAPFEDGPAAQAGVLEGDILVSIDGFSLLPQMDISTVISMLRGPVGTEVVLVVETPGREASLREVSIQRTLFSLPSASAFVLPLDRSVGVIAVTSFSERTSSEVTEGFEELMDRRVRAIILDLRGNAGGLLGSSIQVARIFLQSGLIVVEDNGRDGEFIHSVETPGIAATVPLVVLIDGGTASAGEVLAAALQSNARAPLIGAQTFGKGSVQAIFGLEDGSSLHVTVARWLTPDRRTLDGSGLEPDITLEGYGSSPDPAYQAALEWFGNQDG